MINTEDKNSYFLYQLTWMPAKFAHPAWLKRVGVLSKHYKYGDYPVLDQAINGRLIRYRQFPNIESSINHLHIESKYLNKNRYNRISTALGLFALRCREYLAIRFYRNALQSILSENDIQQLIGLGCGGTQPPQLSAEKLTLFSQSIGLSLLQAHYQSNVVWKATSIQFPPARALYCSQAPYWITLLERYFDFTQINESDY
ncbi:MAG: type III secretion system domain-containing protein [Plesiomonas sp.]